MSHPIFSGSAGRTGFRQASRHTGSTTCFNTDSSQFPRPTGRDSEQDPPMARRDSAPAPAAGAAGAAAQRLADGLARRGGPVRQWAARGLCEGWVPWSRAVYSAVAATPTPSSRQELRRLSNAANNSGLWMAVAAGLGVAGGRAGRRAAVRGTVAIGVTSALVNLGVKSAWSRQRPDRVGAGVPVWRNVRMPTSTSFPSGHAASGFAFAAAMGQTNRGSGWLRWGSWPRRWRAPGAQRSALPGRRRGRLADRRGRWAGRGRPDGPAADPNALPIRSR